MQPFALRGIGSAYLRSLNKPLFRALMRMQGVAHTSAVPAAELDAYVDLLKRSDGGAAFLKIMRGFELTRTKRDLYLAVLGGGSFPIQVIWGDRDPALRIAKHGEAVRRAAGVPEIIRLPGKHFLQEDQAPAIADQITRFVTR